MPPSHDGPRLHFVSNVDGAHIADTLKLLDPETSLFIVASKTFTTIETMTNAATAAPHRGKLGEAAVGHHFAAVSTALDKVGAFASMPPASSASGLGRRTLFHLVGDRLPLMIAIGKENFGRFLDGGHAWTSISAARRFAGTSPCFLGLIASITGNVLGYPSRAILPYDQRLTRFPAYLPAARHGMNGKGVTLDNQPVEFGDPVPWSGASPAPMGSMPSISSSTREPISFPPSS